MQLDLSVIIPCYNCEKTIQRCLCSIPKEVGIEIIIVDDCSTDQTVNEIRKYQDKYPKEHIRLILNYENHGAGEARNIALEMVTKPYIIFLDADDTLSESFEYEVASSFKKEFDCLVFDAEMVGLTTKSILKMFYTDGIIQGEVPQKDALVYLRPATWGKIYRTEIIKEHCIRFGNIQRNEDLVFTKSALCFCNRIRYLEKPLYCYHDNPSSLMHDSSLLTEKNAVNAITMVKSFIIQNGFFQEFNSIYFLEIVYATTITILRMGRPLKECRYHFKQVNAQYNKIDPYRKGYMKKYRLAYLLFNLNLFVLFKLVFK